MVEPGERIDRYLIESVLGQGGMGVVYAALDERLGRRVALKRIRPDAVADAGERLLREARTAAAFEHPNAVVIYDVGDAGGAPYIAMEIVRGKTLRAFVGDASVPPSLRLRWLVDVARALGAAHRAGLVHRDVKPDNVMIRDDGVVKVLDFGIARRAHHVVDPSAPTAAETPGGIVTLTQRGVLVGTPSYSAPEQLRSEEVDGRADQFAWGVTAYELLAGRLPWAATDSVALLAQILSGEPRNLGAAAPTPEVEDAILRALSKAPASRFDSIDDAADAIESFADACIVPRVARHGGARHSTPAGHAPMRTPHAAGSAPPVGSTVAKQRRWKRSLWFVAAGTAIAGAAAFVAERRAGPEVGAASDTGAPVVVRSLGCGPADLGAVASAELARAVGVAACARLAVAVGVPWGEATATDPLTVTGQLGSGTATVRLAVGGRDASGTGPTPLDAVAAAVSSLEAKLAAPPMAPADVHAWGAKDAASARAIERVWRNLSLGISPDSDQVVTPLIAADPDSPWPYVFRSLIASHGTPRHAEASKDALDRVGRLPPARASVVSGAMMYRRNTAEQKEGLQRMRRAYAEAPEDADVAAIYGAFAISAGATEEGLAVLERLWDKSPPRSIVTLRNAVMSYQERNLERDAKYLERLRLTFPESQTWEVSVHHLVASGNFDGARRALALAEELGMRGESTASVSVGYSRAWIELAALEPRKAREMATALLGDPRPAVSLAGSELSISAYLLEGRLLDAEAVQLRELERQRGIGSPIAAAFFATEISKTRRLLGRAPIAGETIDWVERTLPSMLELGHGGAAYIRTEVALARARTEPARAKQIAEKALAGLDSYATEISGGQRQIRDDVAVATLPLVRLARGDAAAARLWRETDRAVFRRRRFAAFEAGLTLEALGERAEAERAYLAAMDTVKIEADAFATLAATVRLAEMYRADGRQADFERLDARLTKLMAAADPGLREAIRKIP